jgi:hypothetical protein
MDDWDDALAICDKLNWGGYTDWRLPDSFELSSIIDSGRYEPAIDTSAFPGTSEQGFWTSSFYATEPDDYWEYRWFIDFWEGTVKWTTPNIANLVRCVRGGPFHGRRFASLTISGDRMVRDDLTQTVWQRCPAGLSGAGCATGTATELLSWQGALSYCESLSYGGYADWRLPNRSELYSIVDIRFYIPAIDLMVFPLPNEYYDYWSSTTNLYDLEAAWQVSFYGGSVERVDKSSESGRVRCVRSEP